MGLFDVNFAILAIQDRINQDNLNFINHLTFYGVKKECLKEYTCKYFIYISELQNNEDEEYKQNIINHILQCDSSFLHSYRKYESGCTNVQFVNGQFVCSQFN